MTGGGGCAILERMADPPRSRKTGEHNPQIVRLIADAAAMREQIAALEERVLRLEAEVAAGRARASKRPPPGPPPLPKTMPALPTMPPISGMAAGMTTKATTRGGRKSIVDISEIAELVDSIPPPAPAPAPAPAPPRPRK